MSGVNENSGKFDWVRGFTCDFDLKDGLSKTAKSTVRHLSNMKDMYADDKAYNEMIASGNDPVVYEFYEMGAPEHAGDLAFGTSITYSGKVGNEYFMTKGHFHTILDTGEVYFCMSGHGYMLLESPEGDWSAQELTAGKVVYVPKRYAHRSINVGQTPLVTFFVFRGDAGHDYGTIETKGYRNLIVEKDGKAITVPNPKWGE
ncbi:MAG: glucose-6-phosphate isomerase [Christensenellaceae bacterium]